MRAISIIATGLLCAASSVLAGGRHSTPLEVPRKATTVTDADAWRELTGVAAVPRAPAQLDTTYLLVDVFDNGHVVCDEMGWTWNDDTQQLDNYWHVDNFNGIAGINGGLVPLQGLQSMWCGARPNSADPIKCSYVNLPGYANDWDQYFRTEQCLAVTGDVDLSFQIFWNSEVDYDHTYIQWDECDENWQDLVSGGLDGLGQWNAVITVQGSSHSGNIRFRFRFQSDGAWSDGDGAINTDGGCTIDALQVSDANGTVLALEDFEDEMVGDHNGDDWISEPAPGYGELAALYPGNQLVNEDPCFTTVSCEWAFINGSTSDYGCGTPAYPEQLTVPYVNARGQYVDQQIRSPWIDIRNTSGAVLELAFSTYWDLALNDYVFADWHVRGIDSTATIPCPSRWYDDGVLDYGDEKVWSRSIVQLGALVPVGSTHIQVSLDVYDRCALGGLPCSSTCHSHSPVYDNVAVYRVSAVGPQWHVQDFYQFQDNFPDDGTITGTARADMAMDLNWDEANQGVVPGDSAVVQVSDPVAGLDTDAGGKAAVFCYVSIDGPHSGTAPTGLICDSRYAYIADESWNGRTWHKFRTDSCFTTGGQAVPGDYNFDFCDNLFVPGDTIWFFWGARNTDGVYTYASAALGTSGNQTADGDVAAINADEFQVLPAVGRDVADGGLGGEILYVDGMNFRGAEPYFDTSFSTLGLSYKVDRYDIRGPSSGVSNHPGNRVKDVIEQLAPIYKVIIWNTGDLDNAFADGTGDLDKSDDTGMCLAFMDNLESLNGGIYLSGDQVASEWLQMTATSALSLRNSYMNFNVTANDHQPVVGYNPWGVGVPGGAFEVNSFPDTLVVQGGCKTPKAFDVLAATGDAQVEMNYYDWSGWFGNNSAPAILGQETENPLGNTAGFMLSGFSYHHIRNLRADGYMDRFDHLAHILWWFGIITDQATAARALNVKRNSLEQNIPNPFNPTTTIRYEVKDSGLVSLKIYNVAGQLVKTLVNGDRSAGRVYEARWNGLDDRGQPVASGVYFYKLVARGFTQTKKMALLK